MLIFIRFSDDGGGGSGGEGFKHLIKKLAKRVEFENPPQVDIYTNLDAPPTSQNRSNWQTTLHLQQTPFGYAIAQTMILGFTDVLNEITRAHDVFAKMLDQGIVHTILGNLIDFAIDLRPAAQVPLRKAELRGSTKIVPIALDHVVIFEFRS
ncbi:hypothetical protein L1987_01607 [Smallanthus sonchifolius]|uniref:Uncharacterized protein n=1 Tax=Smallanthus sonchifolius TaxID=185202 RepID=A0ACB9K5P9_9ASTR|nr:hypothetical protein L1987_01607 [Smallanthus sonchifolius]